MKVIQSCPTLCDPMDYTVHGILQARILEWVAFPFSRGSSQPRDRTQVSGIAGGFFTSWATKEVCYSDNKLLKGDEKDIYIFLSSVQFSHSVVSDSLRLHGLQHARPLCLSSTPGVHSNSRPLSRWCHSTVSSSVVPFSHLQSFPASGCFPISQFFTSGGQSSGISTSASVLPMNQSFQIIQDWFPLGWTG